MEVKLTNELEAFIQDKVRSGRHLDASDVVRDALRVLENQPFESPELEADLLEGLEGTPEPYGPDMWERIRHAVRDKSATPG